MEYDRAQAASQAQASTRELLLWAGSVALALIEDWKKKVEKYEQEAKEIQVKAKELQEEAKTARKKAEEAHHRCDRFDLGELGVELALVLCSVAVLTKRTNFWFAGIAVGLIGAAIGLSGVFVH